MRKTLLSLALVIAAAPLGAQATQQAKKDADPSNKVAGGAPAGWTVRVDDKDAKRNMTATDTKLSVMGAGYHVTSGPAAIYYAPKDNISGDYTVRAKLTQVKAPMHPEAYGIFAGGQKLDTPDQEYLYFLVRGDGKYMISHRAGAEVHSILPWTESAALNKADEKGVATNELAITVKGDSVLFSANGTRLQSWTKAGMHDWVGKGQAGLRVNHNLDVHVGAFEAKPDKK
ncbi:MAG: hypothetical protein JWO05_2690 [Gemmatimonadetes bacterium]|nr:hypothetical protein [Gemmatimonadota bacterium]